VVDDADAKQRGEWRPSTAAGKQILGWSYRHDSDSQKGKCTMTFTPTLPKAGDYEILFWFQPNENRAWEQPPFRNLPATANPGRGPTLGNRQPT